MLKNRVATSEQPLSARSHSIEAEGGPRNGALQQSDIDRLLRGPDAGKSRVRPLLPSPSPMSCLCRVTSTEAGGGLLAVTDDGIELGARPAVSCLVQPCTGDLVLLLVRGDQAWVTAVLERTAADAGVKVDLGNSSLEIHARSISLRARADLEIEAHQTSSRSVVSLTACEERHATIRGTDSTSANCTLIRTDGHMGLHAGNASLSANSLIKIDAGQIHMG